MSQPYIGEIRMFAGNFAPAGWNFCNGALLAISEFSALFTLIGTTYGGDGQNTFALPNLQSRVPVHQGNSGAGTYVMGQAGGVENVTLTLDQIPDHNHLVAPSGSAGDQQGPGAHVLAAGSQIARYSAQAPATAMASTSVASTGNSEPHSNIQPYQAVSFIISLFGIFPSQG
jgi:microcystin-dependent protein